MRLHPAFHVATTCTGLFLSSAGALAKAETIYALTNQNSLVRIDSASPGTVLGNSSVTGLQAGESLVGIDFRPATGMLYGLSSASRLYTVNPVTGIVSFASTLSTTLTGASAYGIDFNPTVDRLRVVHSGGGTNQNLRVNVDTGAATVDGDLGPGASTIGEAAYTNNFAGATTTALYDIDYMEDALFAQTPPNNGTLVRVGSLAGGTDITNSFLGFDISGLTGIGYAALTLPSTNYSSLYTINLATGAGSFVGPIGQNLTVRSLAAPIGSPVPEPATLQLLGMGMTSMAAVKAVKGRLNRKRSEANVAEDNA